MGESPEITRDQRDSAAAAITAGAIQTDPAGRRRAGIEPSASARALETAIAERERRRLGRDLHDGLGQFLTGLAYRADALATALRRERHPAAAEASRIGDLVRAASFRLKTLARGLLPLTLERAGLGAALAELARDARSLFDVAVDLDVDEAAKDVDGEIGEHLYRVAQEAVHNAVKHGAARRVAIHVSARPDRLALRVADDGRGMPEGAERGGGLGIGSMRERARLAGGDLVFDRGASGGTVVTLVAPLGGETTGAAYRP